MRSQLKKKIIQTQKAYQRAQTHENELLELISRIYGIEIYGSVGYLEDSFIDTIRGKTTDATEFIKLLETENHDC